MYNSRKITRNNINKEKMIVFSYCQIQSVLSYLYDYKIGYNSGLYGWNYDLYRINGYDIVTGYNCPYDSYCDVNKKKKLLEIENRLISGEKIDVKKAVEKILEKQA